MLFKWCKMTVTVWRAPVINVRGTKERDWRNARPHEVPGCWVDSPTTATDRTDPRESVSVHRLLYAPSESDILAGDRIEFDGKTYAIDGAPMLRRSPTGRLDHVECGLVDWEG